MPTRLPSTVLRCHMAVDCWNTSHPPPPHPPSKSTLTGAAQEHVPPQLGAEPVRAAHLAQRDAAHNEHKQAATLPGGRVQGARRWGGCQGGQSTGCIPGGGPPAQPPTCLTAHCVSLATGQASHPSRCNAWTPPRRLASRPITGTLLGMRIDCRTLATSPFSGEAAAPDFLAHAPVVRTDRTEAPSPACGPERGSRMVVHDVSFAS